MGATGRPEPGAERAGGNSGPAPFSLDGRNPIQLFLPLGWYVLMKCPCSS